jgi:hypothetical protein
MDDIDEEWNDFMQGGVVEPQRFNSISDEMPEPTNIYISTKSKLGYLDATFDIKKTFWDIPIIEYWKPEEGIVKKQIKLLK